MRITSSHVNLSALSLSSTTSTMSEHLHAWDRESDLTIDSQTSSATAMVQSARLTDRFDRQSPTQPRVPLLPDRAERQSPAKSQVPELTDPLLAPRMDPFKHLGLNKKSVDEIQDVRYAIIKEIVEMMTGKEIKTLDPDDLKNPAASAENGDAPAEAAQQSDQDGPALQGWGFSYERVERKTTQEGFDFSAQGTITTSDGAKIDFSASLAMARQTASELRVSFKAGDALIDPLVLDLSGMGITFDRNAMSFDLNNDGALEQISAPSSASAFLGYDRNGNGIVDNGSELFGPSSGNGFNELAALDDDHNQWIDENDEIYDRLRLWYRSADGTDTISTLAQAGVGALYTDSASTPFTIIKSGDENPLSPSPVGVLRESGIFLRNNGAAGFMHEIDLVA